MMFDVMANLLVAALLTLAAQTAPVSGSLVTGRIFDRATGEPVTGARVTLTPSQVASSPSSFPVRLATSETNTDGVFEARDVPPGRWRIEVQKVGFITASNLPVVVEVAGARVTVPDIRLERGGAIEGRVLDARGDPMVRVTVLTLPRGRMASGSVASAQTNDLGEFRLAGLPDGQHYVVAVPQPSSVSPFIGGSPTASSTTNVLTVYPGSPGLEGGGTIQVNSGVITRGIEFSMLSVPAYQVSGVVVDKAGKPVAGAVVNLALARPPLPASSYQGVPSAVDGTFVIMNVPAGKYAARAAVPLIIRRPNGGMSGSLSFGKGSTELVVRDADVMGVRLKAEQP